MEKLIFFSGGIETLEFFSAGLNNAFLSFGHETFVYNLDAADTGSPEFQNALDALKAFITPGSTTLITFNFNGLRGEEAFYGDTVKKLYRNTPSGSKPNLLISSLINKEYCFWDKYDVNCINIVVDHPIYYHEMLPLLPANYSQVSIDKDHEVYLKKYYPEIKSAGFMPSGGTMLSDYLNSHKHATANHKLSETFKTSLFNENFSGTSPAASCVKDFASRSHDIIFTGNYTPPRKFEAYITRNGSEYEDFYREIIDELITNPDSVITDVFERHLYNNLDKAEQTPENLRICMSSMIFIDLYIRFFYRGMVVKTLVDNGFKVYILGGGWNQLTCRHPENILNKEGTMTDSLTCLKEIADSKISLNVMPWFKNGAHDRIFNSMLNGALCLTDPSRYLNERFTDMKELAFYNLCTLDELPDKTGLLLSDLSLSSRIAGCGFKQAVTDSWTERALFIKCCNSFAKCV